MSPQALARRRLCLALPAAAAAALLGACATPLTSRPTAADAGFWSGRIAIRVTGDASQSFSGDFELQGQPSEGQLTLTSPLGTTLARMDWTPQRARLQRGPREEFYPSVEELVLRGTGVALPLTALFEWLQGRPAAASGWEPDLGLFSEGRITARRTDPAPLVELRVLLSR